MIKLAWHSGHSITITSSDDDLRALRNPLHSLYLRGSLGGKLAQDGSWEIPQGQMPSKRLLEIDGHFSRYGMHVELDTACLAIIERYKKTKYDFELRLRNGALVKDSQTRLSDTTKEVLKKSLFKRVLSPLQEVSLNHLMAVENGANFSVPGSGKTSIALAYYRYLRELHVVDLLIVIGPASCFAPWEAEYGECVEEERRSIRLAGNTSEIRLEMIAASTPYNMILTTYQSTVRDAEYLIALLSQRKTLLVLDESHYAKKPQGGVIANAVLGIAPFACRRLIMSGTPMPNGLMDLWTQFTFLWPEQRLLGDSEAYLYSLQKKSQNESRKEVAAKVSPLFFRITKHQLGLPPIERKTVDVYLNPLQRRIYDGIAAQYLLRISEAPEDKDLLRQWRKARAIRLMQVAVNPGLLLKESTEFDIDTENNLNASLMDIVRHYRKYELPAKVDAACRLANEILKKEKKIIIWSAFIYNLRLVSELLCEYHPVVISGQVPLRSTDPEEISRESQISRFKADDNCHVLIANPAACAESISLHHHCHSAIYLDRSFNCAHYLQSLDRIHRYGLEREIVTRYYIIKAVDTIDEVIDERLQEKMKLMNDVLEGEFSGIVNGYWSNNLGDEEDLDYQEVETHIQKVGVRYAKNPTT